VARGGNSESNSESNGGDDVGNEAECGVFDGSSSDDEQNSAARPERVGGVLRRARDAQDALARKGGKGLAASGRVSGRWVRDAVFAAPAPQVPWSGPWKCTLAGILVHRPGSPLLTIRPLTALDRFGALHLDTEQVGFDGEPVDWARVSELRLREAFEVLTTDALEREVDRIRALFPPVPGRRKGLTYLAENLATVLLAALDQGEDALGRTVLGELHHRGRLPGKRVESPGLFAAALLSLRPDIGAALTDEAARHDVRVTHAESVGRPLPADRDARVAVLRRRTESLVARLARDDEEPHGDGPDDEVPTDDARKTGNELEPPIHLRAHP
jgi:hypothetical protein